MKNIKKNTEIRSSIFNGISKLEDVKYKHLYNYYKNNNNFINYEFCFSYIGRSKYIDPKIYVSVSPILPNSSIPFFMSDTD